MNSIKESWYGNIIPQEDGIFNKPQVKKLLEYTTQHQGELEETLTDKQKELPRKMMDNRNEFDSLAEAEVFEYGFRLYQAAFTQLLAGKIYTDNRWQTSADEYLRPDRKGVRG